MVDNPSVHSPHTFGYNQVWVWGFFVFFLGGGQCRFLPGGGGKLGHSYSFHDILGNYCNFYSFIIHFEFFMGVSTHFMTLKMFMIGGHFKVHDGAPSMCPSLVTVQ